MSVCCSAINIYGPRCLVLRLYIERPDRNLYEGHGILAMLDIRCLQGCMLCCFLLKVSPVL